MNQNVSKEIMKRSRLRNKTVVSHLKNDKKYFYNNFDTKAVADGRLFWKTKKSFLSEILQNQLG